MGTSEKPPITSEDVQTARRLEWAARYAGPIAANAAEWVGDVLSRVGLPDVRPSFRGSVA